jgi:PilZ domain
MGSRSEQRITVCLPVIVRGVDSRGNPFTQTAQTRDISASGARLEGLECVNRAGGEIEVKYQGKKALYRVQWVGDGWAAGIGQVGLRCLERGNYIWGLALSPSTPDDYKSERLEHADLKPVVATWPSSPPVPWAGKDRRQLLRIACRLEAEVSVVGEGSRVPAKVTDLCLGGCYLEMFSPLPLDSAIEVTIHLDSGAIEAHSRVCSEHPGMGMGMSFTGMSRLDLRKLREFAPPPLGATEPAFAKSPARSPESAARTNPSSGAATSAYASVSVSQPHATTAETLEAIVRVLYRKGILNSSELSEELEKMKAGRT